MSKSTFRLSHAGNGRQFGILIELCRTYDDYVCYLVAFEFHITNSSELWQPEILYPLRVLLPLTSPLRSDERNPHWKSLIILADLMTRNEMKLESNKKKLQIFSFLLNFFFAKFFFTFFICCVFSISSCFIRDFALFCSMNFSCFFLRFCSEHTRVKLAWIGNLKKCEKQRQRNEFKSKSEYEFPSSN